MKENFSKSFFFDYLCNQMTKLSIIIPIYDVEQYVRPCIESIFRQDLCENDFELILVNDGSTDSSIEQIQDIIDSHPNIIYINQNHLGLSSARNIGLSKANGQFILFIDSDDLLIDHCLLGLLNIAVTSCADMVIADFEKMDSHEIENRDFHANIQKSKVKEVTLVKSIDYFTNEFDSQCYVWRHLFRKSFLNRINVRFIPNIYFEDIPFTIYCLLSANIVIKVPLTFYVYRQRSKSILSSLNKEKMIDLNFVMAHLWSLMKQTDNALVKARLSDIVFKIFILYKWWIILNKDLYKEKKDILNDLRNRIPDLYFNHGIKQITTTIFIKFMPHLYFRLRYIANKIIVSPKVIKNWFSK